MVAAPAALELWLAHGRPLSSVALIVLHFAPAYIVDTAIYVEAGGTVHPWLTGKTILYSFLSK